MNRENEPVSERSAEDWDIDRLSALLETPEIRARIVRLIEETSSGAEEAPSRWRRLGALSGAISSTLIVLLAFLIPSVQDQWDRFQSRRVLHRHVQLGREFMREGKYKLAEESFAKAIELAENKRPDLEEVRLAAKIQAVNADPTWGAKNPEGLEESDFLYLLHIQRDPQQTGARAATLNCYGVFLASAGRLAEAEDKIREAIRINPEDSSALINLGNLLRDRGRLPEAETAYREALKHEPGDSHIYYDLGVALDELSRPLEAEKAFKQAVDCAPSDPELLRSLAEQLDQNGKPVEANSVWLKLLALTPNDPEAKQQVRSGIRDAKG